MSLILDALKKLEQERSASRGRDLDIRRAVAGRRPAGTASRWRLTLLVGVALVLAVMVVARLIKDDSPRHAPSVTDREMTPAPVRIEAPVRPANADSVVSSPPALSVAVPAAGPRTTPARSTTPSRATIVPEHLSPPPAELKVTGIAWQDERAGRRAVVNGFLAGEGDVVAGYRVVEIRIDQVRFSRDGSLSAVPITSVNR